MRPCRESADFCDGLGNRSPLAARLSHKSVAEQGGFETHLRQPISAVKDDAGARRKRDRLLADML